MAVLSTKSTASPHRNGRHGNVLRRPLGRTITLVTTLRSEGGLFGQKLRATTEGIQTRRPSRATSTLEMDNSVQARYQAYSRNFKTSR
ncbi:hypothetical protein GGI35DRAFT_433290 [Trichoderma velutinum]